MCYLLGGFTEGSAAFKKVFSVCLDDLISQAVSQSAGASAPPTPLPWQSLSQTPLGLSTALAFNGALLAVGGGDYGAQPSIIINLATGAESIKAGELLTERCDCTCTVLPSWGCI